MRYDIVRLLTDYGIDYDITSAEWINVDCPFCGDAKKHGGINLKNNFYNCFKCGGHAIDKALASIVGVSDYEFEDIKKDYDNLLILRASISKNRSPISTIEEIGNALDQREREYLAKRKFDPDYLASKYGLRGGGLTGDYKFRIIIPIYCKNRIVSYTSRAIVDGLIPRYKTLPNNKSIIPAKDVIYNIDNCKNDTIAVVEGPFDAMRIGDSCGATLGVGMTIKQQKMLLSFDRIIFVYDPEPKAQLRAQKQAAQLSSLGKNVYVVNLGVDHDPGDLDENEVKYLRKELHL